MADADPKKKEEKKEEKKEAKQEAAPAAAPAPKKSKTMLFVIIGVVFAVVAIGVPVFLFVVKGNKGETEELSVDAAEHEPSGLVVEGTHDEDELEEGEEPIGAIYPLETFVVNLTGGHYVRCQIQLEFVGREVPKRFYTRIIPVRDRIIEMLSKHTQEELLAEKGKEILKSGVKDIINTMLRKEEVKQVYLSQFLIQ